LLSSSSSEDDEESLISPSEDEEDDQSSQTDEEEDTRDSDPEYSEDGSSIDSDDEENDEEYHRSRPKRRPKPKLLKRIGRPRIKRYSRKTRTLSIAELKKLAEESVKKLRVRLVRCDSLVLNKRQKEKVPQSEIQSQ